MNTTETHVWPPELQKLIDEGKVRPPVASGTIGRRPGLSSNFTIEEVLAEDRGD